MKSSVILRVMSNVVLLGSGGFMTDLVFYGGLYGAVLGNRLTRSDEYFRLIKHRKSAVYDEKPFLL